MRNAWKRLDGRLALAPVQVRHADLVGGPDGLGVRGGVGQEPAEGGDAEVELGVVGRVGDAVGPGDLIERASPQFGQILRRRLGNLGRQVAGQVGPGHPGGDVLLERELGLAQVEPRGVAVGPFGIFLEILLEVADRTDGRVGIASLRWRAVRHHGSGAPAGPGHRVQERGAKGVPFRQLACLGQQGVGGVRIGLGDRVIGREQSAGEGVIDLGEPVLAVGAEERLRLRPSQGLGGARATGGQLDGGQLEADLRHPRAFRLEFESIDERPPRLLGPASQPLGDPPEESIVGFVGSRPGLGDQAIESRRCLGILPFLHRRDHRGRDVGSDRSDRPPGRRRSIGAHAGHRRDGQQGHRPPTSESAALRCHGGSLPERKRKWPEVDRPGRHP